MQQMLRRDVFLWLISSLHEILLVFVFEIRSENTLADVFADFILCPESATGQFFLARFHLAIIYTAMYVNQFLFPLTLKDIMPQIVRQPIETWKEELVNDFEAPIFKMHPELAEIKQKLYNLGAVYAAMSGSGSAIFGIFKHKPANIEEQFEGMFCKIMKL
jgi:predicted membrane protein